MKTTILSLALMLIMSAAATNIAFAQGGYIKGNVVNSVTNEPIPLVNVYLKYGDNLIGAQSDFDGKFTIKPIPPGTYSVFFRCVGYGEKKIDEVIISADKYTFLNDVPMVYGITFDTTATIIGRKLIDPELTSLEIIDNEVISSVPNYGSINKLASIAGSDIQVSDDDNEIYFRGSRSGDALYIIDGMRMINPSALCPSLAIGEMMVYTGGVPAKYGDFTGGVIVIETQSYFEWLAAQESARLKAGGF